MAYTKMRLVNCPREKYMEQRYELRSQGLKEWQDFKWHGFADRKVCLISANCHGPAIEKFLLSQKSFTDKYDIHPFMAVGAGGRRGKNVPLDDELLSGVDLLLFQRMRSTNVLNKSYADENLLVKVPKNCQCISVPNFWSLGGVIHQTQSMKLVKDSWGATAFYKDDLLDLAYEKVKKRDIKTVLEYLDNWRMDFKQAQTRAQEFWQKWGRWEENWDIKVSDWFLNNYKVIPTFNDIGHPSAYMMWEVGRRIMQYMGLTCEEFGRKEYIKNFRLGVSGILHSSIAKVMGINADPAPIGRDFYDYVHELSTGRREKGTAIWTIPYFIQNYFLVRFGELLPYNMRRIRGIDAQDVVEAYRWILGREPESDKAIEVQLRIYDNVTDMRKGFLRSPEFANRYKELLNKN